MSKCEQCIVRQLNSLKSLNKEELVRISACKTSRIIKKGEVLFEEGDHINGVFCISDGICKVSKMSSNGRDQIIHLVHKGDILGERSLINDEVANLKATAINDMEVCFIPREEIIKDLQKNPEFSMNVLNTVKFDVVITNIALQKISAVKLLKSLAHTLPAMIRVVIDDHSTSIKHIDSLAHYNFEQPINAESIVKSIVSLTENKKTITKESIIKAVAQVKTLPSPPKVYMQLNAILKHANSDSDKIANIITQDPALAAKVIQTANNIFGQREKPLASIADAITKLGVDTLSCIVMTAEMFSYQPDIPNFSLVDEQMHCLATARFAASLVSNDLKQDTLLSGLLHDIGKLVLFEIDKTLTLKYFENAARTSGAIELEEKIFSTNHSQVGAYLLHIWSFPYYLIDAVVNHHHPKKLLTTDFGIAQAVYLANSLLNNTEVDSDFIKHFDLTDNIDKLKEKAQKYK